jgi:hypothetical protein
MVVELEFGIRTNIGTFLDRRTVVTLYRPAWNHAAVF